MTPTIPPAPAVGTDPDEPDEEPSEDELLAIEFRYLVTWLSHVYGQPNPLPASMDLDYDHQYRQTPRGKIVTRIMTCRKQVRQAKSAAARDRQLARLEALQRELAALTKGREETSDRA